MNERINELKNDRMSDGINESQKNCEGERKAEWHDSSAAIGEQKGGEEERAIKITHNEGLNG